MPLIDFFKRYNLTGDQLKAVDELGLFLESPKLNCFLLKGHAGTGKTFLIKGLTEDLAENGRLFKLASLIGRGARILSQITENPAVTIHMMIYEGFYGLMSLKANEDPPGTIYIVERLLLLAIRKTCRCSLGKVTS
jgi:hypothetical protein